MNNTDALNLLNQIKDLYIQIKQNSVSFIGNFSDEALTEFLHIREKLLKEIHLKEAEYSKFKKSGQALVSECRDVKMEISELVLSTIGLDARITDKIKKSMTGIKNELSGLYSSSKAALAYTSHRR